MRKIIVADIQTSPGSFFVTSYMWLTIPAARRLPPQSTRLPAQGPNLTWGATAPELAAFAAGTLIEVVSNTNPFPTNTSAAAVQSALVTTYTAEQAKLDATSNASLASFIGIGWDGAAWA